MTRPLPEAERTTHLMRTVLADRYELLGLLGRGGMSEVHRAHDHELDRIVAVKLVHADRRDDPTYAERLRGEAKAAAALLHPNVVPVFDVGTTGAEVFVVMEYVEGRTLGDELRERGPFPAAEAASDAAAVCEALAAAHERGIVHRDVNPGNVMRCSDGTVKLMDFGIARMGDAESGAKGLTGSGVVIGTAAYMAPEQVRCEPLDGRADMYSLGCSLYELVTGRTPFTGASGVELAALRLRERPTPPRRLMPSVPNPLERVILRSLALEPDDRFPDARAMAEELRATIGDDAAGRGRDAVPRPRGPADSGRTPGLANGATGSTEVLDSRAGADPASDSPSGDAASDIAPGAGESEPWSVVRRLGLALVVLAVLAMLAAALLVAVR